MRVVLYGKPDCGLCDELKQELLEIQKELQFELIERNILEDAETSTRYRYLIPVLDIEGGELLYPPHRRDIVHNALRSAYRQAT
jgi:thiol-disulfide isomerase/thioredoxin